LSTEHLEFLSIDIASLDDLIGIEVDGPAHYINILGSHDGGKRDTSQRTDDNINGMAMKIGSKMGWQFVSSTHRQVNGPTALKHRLLGHLGWRIFHMPFWEWREVDGDKQREEAYCTELLDGFVR